MITKKHILITGAGGLLGRHVLAAWRGSHHLHAVVHTLPAVPVPDVHYRVIDLAAPWDDTQLPDRIDVVCHLAQSARMRDFPASAADIFQVNTQATALLLGYALRAGAARFMLASTGGLYAAAPEPLTHDAPLDPHADSPLGYYFASKRCAEILAQAYAGVLQVTILRPFFIYGGGQQAAMLVPRLIASIRNGTPVRLRGDTGMRLNPVAVADVAAVMDVLLDRSDHPVLNVAGPDIVSIRDMAEQIGRQLGMEPKFDNEIGVADTMIADVTAMKNLLGRPLTGFAKGIAAMLQAEQ